MLVFLWLSLLPILVLAVGSITVTRSLEPRRAEQRGHHELEMQATGVLGPLSGRIRRWLARATPELIPARVRSADGKQFNRTIHQQRFF